MTPLLAALSVKVQSRKYLARLALPSRELASIALGVDVNNTELMQGIKALLAVMELHKPVTDEWFNVGEIICEECTREEYTRQYPCPTIQAIEKELS